MVDLIQKVLYQKEKYQMCPTLIKALSNFSKIYNLKKQKKKHKYLLQLKNAGITFSEATQFGYKINYYIWRTNLIKERNSGGRPKIKQLFKEEIQNHVDDRSTLAVNRFLKLQNENVKYRNFTFKDIYRTFLYHDNISFSTFRNYIPIYIKNHHRLSDLCNYCENYRVIRNFIFKHFNNW